MDAKKVMIGQLAKITEEYLQWYRINVGSTPLFVAGDVVEIVEAEGRGMLSVRLHNGVLNASGVPAALLVAFPEV